MHGLHVVGGLVALGRTDGAGCRAAPSSTDVRLSVALCARYWHFLLVVWLVLFALLPGSRRARSTSAAHVD